MSSLHRAVCTRAGGHIPPLWLALQPPPCISTLMLRTPFASASAPFSLARMVGSGSSSAVAGTGAALDPSIPLGGRLPDAAVVKRSLFCELRVWLRLKRGSSLATSATFCLRMRQGVFGGGGRGSMWLGEGLRPFIWFHCSQDRRVKRGSSLPPPTAAAGASRSSEAEAMTGST